MKTFVRILLTIIITFSSFEMLSQKAIITTKHDYFKGTVVLKNGQELKGLIYREVNLNIRFKMTRDDKLNKIKKEEISEIKISDNIFKYVNYLNGSKTKILALEKIIDGDVSLFVRREYHKERSLTGSYSSFRGSYEKHYYIGNSNGESLIYLKFANSYSSKFLKRTDKYFSDCPELIQKIDNRGFERNDIEGIVNYYNSECGNH